jgi:hypothetical protein
MLQALGEHSKILSADRESPFIPYVGFLLNPFEFRHNLDYHKESLNVSLDYEYELFRRLCFECVYGEYYGFDNLTRNFPQKISNLLGKQYWCAKTYPNQAECNGLIRLYPSIRFIYIFRNGCDVVHSRSKFRGMSQKDFSEQCEIWAKDVRKYMYLFDVEQSIQVHHEDLVADPGQVFQRVLSFLGINFEEGPEIFARTTHVHPLDKRTQTNIDVAKVMQERRPGYESWTDEQKQTFVNICEQGMQALGYEIPF